MELRTVTGEDVGDLEAVRELFREYQTWLGGVVCAANLGPETAGLPSPYTPPRGTLLVAVDEGGWALGCVGLRPLRPGVDVEVAEMKRLYVRPAARARGVGTLLVEATIEAARGFGFREILLDTLPGMMDDAIRLYGRLGFVSAPPYDSGEGLDPEGLAFLRRSL